METSREKLVHYLKNNIQKGYTEESLKWALVQQGHSRTEVSKAIELARKEMEKENEQKDDKEKPKIKYELYGEDNKIINIEERKPFSFKNFFRNLFS